jgi:hypothetical protein
MIGDFFDHKEFLRTFLSILILITAEISKKSRWVRGICHPKDNRSG